MNKKIEYYLKSIVRRHHCPTCLNKLLRKYPNMLDCIYRANNDEHLCPYAEKYYDDFDL